VVVVVARAHGNPTARPGAKVVMVVLERMLLLVPVMVACSAERTSASGPLGARGVLLLLLLLPASRVDDDPEVAKRGDVVPTTEGVGVEGVEVVVDAGVVISQPAVARNCFFFSFCCFSCPGCSGRSATRLRL
jgi:hypothetical protein